MVLNAQATIDHLKIDLGLWRGLFDTIFHMAMINPIIFLTLVVVFRLFFHQLIIKDIFLHGDLTKEIKTDVEQPQEFIAKEEIDLIKIGKKNVVWAKATFKHLIQKLVFSFAKKVLLLSQEGISSWYHHYWLWFH